MTCKATRQGDEMFCAPCRLRWDHAGDPVECRGAPEVPKERDALRLRVAKAINGPHREAHIGREMMLRLRDHSWGTTTTPNKRQILLNAAEAVLKELDL